MRRHPASGYVQGINDLVTPFLTVFLSEHFSDGPMEVWDVTSLSEETRTTVEADCYWCLCKLLDGIQDHYTYAQPGIQRTVFAMKELVRYSAPFSAQCIIAHDEKNPDQNIAPIYRRIEEPFSQHLESEGLEFLQFSFRCGYHRPYWAYGQGLTHLRMSRWVNCLLLREVPFALSLRLWDTYLAEGPRMKEFLVYVLAAFLLYWAPQLRSMDFQVTILINLIIFSGKRGCH